MRQPQLTTMDKGHKNKSFVVRCMAQVLARVSIHYTV